MNDTLYPQLKVENVVEAGEFSGYASTDCVDKHGERIVYGAFSKSIAWWKGKRRYPPILWQHKQEEVIGCITHMEEVRMANGRSALRIRGKLLLSLEKAKEAYILIKSNIVKTLSVGINIKRSKVNSEGVRELLEVDLRECSVVTDPANEEAEILEYKSKNAANDILKSAEKVKKLLRQK
ncbi:HK97 family phage prohead protease [Candidatus Hydrogenosomobacter endosymbioticus]|uniref:Primosomal replication protein N n=1 Tax=Candidatus Hydrogenosomobacter endosymbioticus TaxID=2558174 RepID=A0ABN6L5Y0_9PROT|nr:HK97 family phage prohead protease [Candidatus Hydrogenosomobacter endosymbioticus]BDB95911.1 primosomal replication protein N [Candidatus Hydrogenosomobacter endosymbioticus]